ncbi:hypothetical protein JCM3765_000802 [Sporobolomyces pararoseus]
MVRRKHQSSTSASPTPSNRLPALLISFSSLLLSAGLATTLYVLTESISEQLDDGDLDQAGVVAWWTADAGFKWGLISSVGSLCGVTGILLGNASLHRVFAVSTFADLLLTLLLTFTLSLLTLLPSLSPTFGSFLCSSILSSSYDSPSSSSSRVLHVERDGGSNSEGGLLQWGVEACEENWKVGMYKVIVGCLVTIGLRIYGTYISWEHNSELRELELNRLQGGGGDLGWVDEGVTEPLRRDSQEMRQFGKNVEESNHRRSRSHSSSSTRRSNTLPATGLPPRYSDDSNSRPRSQSSSASNGGRPRLVLLPVYVDRHGNPIGSPPASPPAYRSRSSTSPISPSSLNPPPRRSNSTKSSSSSTSRSTSRPPPPPRKRSQSATVTTTSKRSPSLPRYTEEPSSLSPSSSGSTTPTCLTNSSTESTLNGRSRKTRHTRSDTDPSSTAVTSGYCLTSSPTKLKVDNKALPVIA